MLSLSTDDVRSILSSPSLRLESDDKLYQLISARMEDDFSYSSLLEFVHFEFLSTATIAKFVSGDFDAFLVLNRPIWTSLCHRLVLPITPGHKEEGQRYKIVSDNAADSSDDGFLGGYGELFG
jgi:hypothetical protein